MYIACQFNPLIITMSGPGVPSSAPSRRQKRMGPAPFASFEDLSDEVRSRVRIIQYYVISLLQRKLINTTLDTNPNQTL